MQRLRDSVKPSRIFQNPQRDEAWPRAILQHCHRRILFPNREQKERPRRLQHLGTGRISEVNGQRVRRVEYYIETVREARETLNRLIKIFSIYAIFV